MFLLKDGPRDGQLVDELPADYEPQGDPGRPRLVSVFEDYIAQVAVWSPGYRPAVVTITP